MMLLAALAIDAWMSDQVPKKGMSFLNPSSPKKGKGKLQQQKLRNLRWSSRLLMRFAYHAEPTKPDQLPKVQTARNNLTQQRQHAGTACDTKDILPQVAKTKTAERNKSLGPPAVCRVGKAFWNSFLCKQVGHDTNKQNEGSEVQRKPRKNVSWMTTWNKHKQ